VKEQKAHGTGPSPGSEGGSIREVGGCQEGPSRRGVGSDLGANSRAEFHSDAFPIHKEGASSIADGTLGFCPSSSPQIQLVERGCGLIWVTAEWWKGTVSGDQRPFASMVRKSPAPIVMVPPGRPRGWGRKGFGAGCVGGGGGSTMGR
jgi:hypothetical protein